MARPSKAVYRRRRLVFFSAIILVAAVIGVGIWLLIAQPWADAATPKPSPSPTASASGTPTPDASADASPSPEPTDGEAAPAPCNAPDIAVEAITDADTYAAGELPELSISLTNNGAAACTLDVGSATQSCKITSGDDEWWRSSDCQEKPNNMVVTLEAGQNVTSAEPVTWDRTRSDVSTCDDENRPLAPAGGSSYHVAVSIGGFEATSSRQILLY